MSLSYLERSWWGEGKGSMRRRKRGRLHRKRRFYDPKDGENITCVAKAHTLRAAPRSALVLYIYIQRILRLAAIDAPFKCVYLYSSRVCVRVNSIVFTAFTIRIKTLKRYSFRLVLPPHPSRDINVHILCARRRQHTNPAQQLRWIKKKTNTNTYT